MNKDTKTDFIGIGATKCATTWIFQCLKEHPQICGSKPKGTHFFFDSSGAESLKEYSRFFDHCNDDNTVKGEFDHYLYDKKAPFRIKKRFPKVKIIVSLRDPIERAYSRYRVAKNKKQYLTIFPSFYEALQNHPPLIERGLYYKYLKKYYELFPKENIFVVMYKDIKNEPLSVIRQLYSFLEVNPVDFKPDSINRKENATGKIKVKTKISLLNYFLLKLKRKVNKDSKIYSLMDKIGFRRARLKLLRANQTKYETQDYKGSNKNSIKFRVRKNLHQLFDPETRKLETLIDKNLDNWKEI